MADFGSGLCVIDVSDPTAPVELGSLDTEGSVYHGGKGRAAAVPLRHASLARMYECAYTDGMAQWDREKAFANWRKHGIDSADAATALEDELALTVQDDDPDEERYVSLGEDALGRVRGCFQLAGR